MHTADTYNADARRSLEEIRLRGADRRTDGTRVMVHSQTPAPIPDYDYDLWLIQIHRFRFRSHSYTRQLGWESESDSVQCEKYIVQCNHMVNSYELNGKSGTGTVNGNCWGLGFGVQSQKINQIVGITISVTNKKAFQ